MVYTEPAFAKLNLTLDILGRRPDNGFEELVLTHGGEFKADVAGLGAEAVGDLAAVDVVHLTTIPLNLRPSTASSSAWTRKSSWPRLKSSIPPGNRQERPSGLRRASSPSGGRPSS